MPDPRGKPVSASESSASDEESKLELYLQRQLEDDVARIFDESIYSDLEVVCGKLKILTHSCILKARTDKFYQKLKAILHVNLGKEAFDEIYSFISDAYTECDITNQEKEILIFLKSKFFTKNKRAEPVKTKDETDDIEVFLTPNCPSPYVEKNIQQISCLSPSTGLTKEYYALVHIEGNLLEQELIEQDALSNAFQTIIKSQDKESNKVSQRNKPTSLSLISSHSPKPLKHSNDCDIYNKIPQDKTTLNNGKNCEKKIIYNPSAKALDSFKNINKTVNINNDLVIEKNSDLAYSPDSLITDDPSSASDYVSAAYATSPALGSSSCLPQLNASESIKMEKIFNSSDSGLENTGLLESLSSHKDVTLADISLTESTLHDLTAEETHNSQESSSSPETDNQIQRIRIPIVRTIPLSICTTSQGIEFIEKKSNPDPKSNDLPCKSSKEEKQRQNEEILILESSSVSSETGSWESVFPPKMTDKEACDKFIQSERQNVSQVEAKTDQSKQVKLSESPKFAHFLVKTTPCFIDAANLVDEEQAGFSLHDKKDSKKSKAKSKNIPVPSKPMPCSTIKGLDISPGDWSESNDNEDSLEQPDNKEPDSIQKDLSPTIFEMTPITEDSLSTNDIAENKDIFQMNNAPVCDTEKGSSLSSSTVYMGTTPHNSIMSLKTPSLKHYDSEENETETIVASRDNLSNFKSIKYNDSCILASAASSEILNSSHSGTQNCSPLIRRKIENSLGADKHRSFPISSNSVSASAWVVDMSLSPKISEGGINSVSQQIKRPSDKMCENLKNESRSSSNDNCNKSRSSVDSDSSEKSGHKFYIDLSTLPDPLPPEKKVIENNTEKKNIFSMYIDLGEKSTIKEMPSRLSNSLNVKKHSDKQNFQQNTKMIKITHNDSPICNLKSHDQHELSVNFEKYESLCNDPNISISEIIAIPETTPRKSKEFNDIEIKNEKSSRRLMANEKIFRVSKSTIHEESTEPSPDLFVKLSDLDKPIQKSDIYEKEFLDPRMTRSIPDNNWSEQNAASTSRSSEVISSFHSENALSLNRLFPHLKNEFSKSMPISLSGRTKSPLRQGVSSSVGEIEEQVSDVSEISSIHSSMCRSVIENSTTEEISQTSSLIGNCQSRLGQDLLRMFLEEIAPDVIVEVSGKRIKAHKCILSSRCQYFAGILSGGWVESAGNVIVLPPFSFSVVHFALCHIYSGLSSIPDTISIVELATIADMLGLEGLKEAIMFTLKAKYCHHFHRPCQVCTAGVLECFPLSSVYGLDDLYRKCLRWITRYFVRVWPTKSFATLPKELLDKCYQEHIVNLSIDNLIDTVYGCGITVASLQNSRWAEVVARMCRRLVNAAAHFTAPRLLAVLEIVSTAPDGPQAAKQALDDCLAAAIEWAPPDETCRAYSFLSHLVKEIRSQNLSKPDIVSNGSQNANNSDHCNFLYTHASSWRLQCEGALVRAAPRVVGTQAFKDLPSDLRRRLRELGCIMYGPQAIPLTTSPLQDRKSKSTYQSKPTKTLSSATTRSLDMEKVRNSFVPYKPKPTVTGPKVKVTSNSDLQALKKLTIKPNMPKVRTTKAQEERAKFNQTKTISSQDRTTNNNKSVLSRGHMFENTKPRYLEPRQSKEKEKKITPKKLVNKIVSSSESSRNSSPVQLRNLRSSRMMQNQKYEHKAHALSQDSLATSSRPRTAEPSTDSLSESQNSNKYATYTKTKHTSKGSVESVIAKCQGLSPSSLLSANVKTKIPVYLNTMSCNGNKKSNVNAKGQGAKVPASNKNKGKTCDRKISGSLMNATKSSSAKIVPKIAKESQAQTTKLCKQQKPNSRHSSATANMQAREDQEHEHLPLMQRSGTFSKDEPTFGDKYSKIDKSQ